MEGFYVLRHKTLFDFPSARAAAASNGGHRPIPSRLHVDPVRMHVMEVNRSILEMVLNAEHPLSGEEMASRLGVSRTAVWKAINHLRQQGFSVEARRGVGYVVTGFPDRLLPQMVQKDLGTRVVGSRVECFDVIDSTNTRAREAAHAGERDGAVFTAEEQTAGRGRLKRTWLSPKGSNLLFSVLLRPSMLPSQIFRLNMTTTVAIAEALEQWSPLKPLIKWPNDIYLNGRKAAGILTEFSGTGDGVEYAVVGVGLNVNVDPSALGEVMAPATSVRHELGKPVSRLDLLREILRRFDYHYCRMLDGTDAGLRGRWNEYSLVAGRRVVVTSFDTTEFGTAVSVEDDGALLLETEDGRRKRIVCGDVSLRMA